MNKHIRKTGSLPPYLDPLPKLELDKKRFRVKQCPCGKSNKDGKFVPYIGHEDKGYCHGCGEVFLPELPLKEAGHQKQWEPKPSYIKQEPLPSSFIPTPIFEQSFTGYEYNHLVTFLNERFGADITTELIGRYLIGTSDYWYGATVFWQIDVQGRVRTGKVMLYSAQTGKRVKEPRDHFNFMHSCLKLPDFRLSQCLFGEHLLNDKTKPVAIVESEKTAIIASVYLPQFHWLATGGVGNLTPRMCSSLKGQDVVLYPDISFLDDWRRMAQALTGLRSLSVSDLLERKAAKRTEMKGLDIADILLRFSPSDFVPEQQCGAIPSESFTSENVGDAPDFEVQAVGCSHQRQAEAKVESWAKEVEALEAFFDSMCFLPTPIQLNSCSTIFDPAAFFSSHVQTLKRYDGKARFLPYLERLRALKDILSF